MSEVETGEMRIEDATGIEASQENDMYEVKTDPLEASFDADARQEMTALRAEMGSLRARIDAQAIAAGRPALSGIAAARPEAKAFVERYLRKGAVAGVELKAFEGTSGGEGGYRARLLEA